VAKEIPSGTRVVVVDDHPLFRSALVTLLGVWGYDVVGQAADGESAIAVAREFRPEMVFMDINMPTLNGLDATRVIKSELPETRVVVLTASEDEGDLLDAIRSGADGYLVKNMDGGQLAKLLGQIERGEPVFPPALATSLLAQFRDPVRSPKTELTERESTVLGEVAAGATSREIGQHLDISENTVNFHLKNIFSKLHLRNRAQVVAWAAQHGYLEQQEHGLLEQQEKGSRA